MNIQKFIEQATIILIEENERIKKETGDEIMTYYTSNVGFSQNIGRMEIIPEALMCLSMPKT